MWPFTAHCNYLLVDGKGQQGFQTAGRQALWNISLCNKSVSLPKWVIPLKWCWDDSREGRNILDLFSAHLQGPTSLCPLTPCLPCPLPSVVVTIATPRKWPVFHHTDVFSESLSLFLWFYEGRGEGRPSLSHHNAHSTSSGTRWVVSWAQQKWMLTFVAFK